MAKLYFRYGVMGSSKSAQALITKFNYEEQGMRVWLIKPAADTRYGTDVVRSRIGLEQTRHDPHQGRLSGAVRPDKAGQAAVIDLGDQATQRMYLAEALVDTVDDHGHAVVAIACRGR